jgi:hypothetical protein
MKMRRMLMLVPLLAMGACETMTAEHTTFEEMVPPPMMEPLQPLPHSEPSRGGVRLYTPYSALPDSGPQGVYQPSQNQEASLLAADRGTPGKRKGTTTTVRWSSLNGKTLGSMVGTIYQTLDGAAPGGLLPWLLGGAGTAAGTVATAVMALFHGKAKDKAWDQSQLATLMMMQGRLPASGSEPSPTSSNQSSQSGSNRGT